MQRAAIFNLYFGVVLNVVRALQRVPFECLTSCTRNVTIVVYIFVPRVCIRNKVYEF